MSSDEVTLESGCNSFICTHKKLHKTLFLTELFTAYCNNPEPRGENSLFVRGTRVLVLWMTSELACKKI